MHIRLPPWAMGLTVYCAAAAILLHALVAHPTTDILRGFSDGTSQLRDYMAAAHLHTTPFTQTRDPLNGAPEGRPLAWAIQVAEAFQPGVVWLLHYPLGFIGAWNLFTVSGFVLTAWATFMLLMRLGASFGAALFGGYAFGFSPWAFERAQAGAPAFVHAWIFPVLLGSLLWTRSRPLVGGLVAGAAYAGAFYVASYFGLLATLMVLLWCVVEVFTATLDGRVGHTLKAVCSMAVGSVVCLTPAIASYAADTSRVSDQISNGESELQSLGSRVPEYFLPYGRQPFVGFLTRQFPNSGNFPEQTLFFGYSTLLLAATAYVLLIRRRQALPAPRAATYCALLAPAAFVCSLPSHFGVFGVAIPTPSAAVAHVTTFWRVYARFGVLFGFGCAVLAALALTALERRPRLRHITLVALVVLAGFEFLPGNVPAVDAETRPPDVQWLAAHPGGIVATYPAPTDQSAALFLAQRDYWYQRFDWHPLYGYFGSGTGGTREDAIRILSRYITDPATPSILAAEHVRYVVIHDDVFRQENATPPAAPAQLALVARFPNVRIYRLRASTQPADLDQLLAADAAEVATVQGLTSPSIEYGGGITAVAGAAEELRGDGTITLDNTQPGLKRLQILVSAQTTAGRATLSAASPSGAPLGSWSVGANPTSIVIGPFGLPQGLTTLRVTEEGAGAVRLQGVNAQPLADYSVSLAAES